MADDLLDLTPYCFQADVHHDHRLRRDAFALVYQPQQHVLGADVVVVEQARFFLCEHDNSPGAIREPFEPCASLAPPCWFLSRICTVTVHWRDKNERSSHDET